MSFNSHLEQPSTQILHNKLYILLHEVLGSREIYYLRSHPACCRQGNQMGRDSGLEDVCFFVFELLDINSNCF